MEDKLLQFYKFIIKHVVNTVEYNPESDEYKINRTSLSDDTLVKIIEEGQRYGLTSDECIQIISRVSANINTKPSVNVVKSQFDSRTIALGQHIEVCFAHPRIGENAIELIGGEKHRLIVLKSSISGLTIFDELEPVTLIWNPNFYIDFIVYRNGKQYPNTETKLLIGKYTHLLIYEPSIVNEIIDSDKDFAKKRNKSNPAEQTLKENYKTAFVWTPNQMNPIAFTFDENSSSDTTAPFVISYTENSTIAKISLNRDFVLPNDQIQRKYLLQIFADCCKSRNLIGMEDNLKFIRTLQEGMLQKNIKEKSVQQWILVSKPQIKYILG